MGKARPANQVPSHGSLIAGVDEAGRGPLAGPVVAAAVVLGARPPAGLADSKQLTARRRQQLFQCIVEQCAAVSYAAASPRKIDDVNVLQATLRAMGRAVVTLAHRPDVVHVDGNHRIPRLAVPQKTLVKGDERCPAIAAASIVAKVVRDRMMASWSIVYPEYGFDANKGYGTAPHLDALSAYGPCAVHRFSFAPVRQRDLFPTSPTSVTVSDRQPQ